jgi:hypothetical protein
MEYISTYRVSIYFGCTSLGMKLSHSCCYLSTRNGGLKRKKKLWVNYCSGGLQPDITHLAPDQLYSRPAPSVRVPLFSPTTAAAAAVGSHGVHEGTAPRASPGRYHRSPRRNIPPLPLFQPSQVSRPRRVMTLKMSEIALVDVLLLLIIPSRDAYLQPDFSGS